MLKFKRGQIPQNEVIAHAISLGLFIEPSFVGADCCFVYNKSLSFGEVDSPKWKYVDNKEISEEEFMQLTKI